MNNNSVMVHYAVACLEGLESPVTPGDLSRSQHVPLKECVDILRKLQAAGLIREKAEGVFERTCSIDELTALQVLQALWTEPAPEPMHLLYGNGQLKTDQVMRIVMTASWPRG